MKKVLMSMLLMMSAATMSAQWYVAPEAGLTAVRPFDYYAGDIGGWKPYPKMGAAVGYQFTHRFALKSGFYYLHRGYSLNQFMTYYDFTQEEEPWKLSVQYLHGKVLTNYLQLPVMAEFSWRLWKDVKLNAGVGGYVSMSMKHRVDSEILLLNNLPEDNMVQSVDASGTVTDRTIGGGIALTLGLEVNNLLFNAGYDAALTDGFNGEYHTVSLTVGYKFKFGK